MAALSEQAGLPRLQSPADVVSVRRILSHGEVEVLGRMPWSSNATFMAHVRGGEGELLAIYKPRRGERPLWDFPEGTLCNREVGAAVVADLLGWSIVPDTVLRDDLPNGSGSLQQFVDHDPDEHYFTLLNDHVDDFRRFAVFDIVVNNTDRKGGHLLRSLRDGTIFGIDHGVCFHQQWKVRTVIWEFGGELIPEALLADLECLCDRVLASDTELDELLTPVELAALVARVEQLLATRHYPVADADYRHYPWPLV